MARKVKTFVVKLVSMAGTGFFYTTKRNMRSQKPKLLVRKYDPVIRLHTLFRVRFLNFAFLAEFISIFSLFHRDLRLPNRCEILSSFIALPSRLSGFLSYRNLSCSL